MIPGSPALTANFIVAALLFIEEVSVGQHEKPAAKIVAVHAEAPAERLFFGQFRLWMSAHGARDPRYLDYAFKALLHFVAFDAAQELFCEFGVFTGILTEQARAAIEWRLSRCRCLCRDEFLALRLVAASQREDLAEEHAAASEILETQSITQSIKPLLIASRSLAQALELKGFVLAPIERLGAEAALPPISHGWTLQ